jgi:hypothetical protein
MVRAPSPFVVLVSMLGACTADGPLDRSVGYGGNPVKVEVADVPVKGFPVVVERVAGDDIEGELIASNELFVRVLTGYGRLLAVPWKNIREVRVQLQPSMEGARAGLGVWTALGTLSTLSHGFWLVFSAPIWLGAGIPSTILTGRPIEGSTSSDEATYLHQFARFPQGLPPRWEGGSMPTPRAVPTAPDAGALVFDASPDLDAGATGAASF